MREEIKASSQPRNKENLTQGSDIKDDAKALDQRNIQEAKLQDLLLGYTESEGKNERRQTLKGSGQNEWINHVG